MDFRKWRLGQKMKQLEKMWEKPVKGTEMLELSPCQGGLYITTYYTSSSYDNVHVLETIICDLIYDLLKKYSVVVKNTGKEITPAGFGTTVERVEEGLFRNVFMYIDAQGQTCIYTNDFNKFEVCQYVICTDIMDIAESSRLYAVRKDISGHLKSGMLAAEGCIERDEYDFYITPGGDRNGITIYRPSHEYCDIVETIKEVMAPYGLAVMYREIEKKNTINEK